MDRFQSKYRIPPARLKDWDYGSQGLYFVTICTKDRQCYFEDNNGSTGSAVETQYFASLQQPTTLQYTSIGIIAHQYWTEIPNHFPFVELDEFVIMPNHVHGIIHIVETQNMSRRRWQPNKFGPQSKNLASVIRGYKAGAKAYAAKYKIEFAWQTRYYDHVIRTSDELDRIRQYIIDNPVAWKGDRNNPENLMM